MCAPPSPFDSMCLLRPTPIRSSVCPLDLIRAHVLPINHHSYQLIPYVPPRPHSIPCVSFALPPFDPMRVLHPIHVSPPLDPMCLLHPYPIGSHVCPLDLIRAHVLPIHHHSIPCVSFTLPPFNPMRVLHSIHVSPPLDPMCLLQPYPIGSHACPLDPIRSHVSSSPYLIRSHVSPSPYPHSIPRVSFTLPPLDPTCLLPPTPIRAHVSLLHPTSFEPMSLSFTLPSLDPTCLLPPTPIRSHVCPLDTIRAHVCHSPYLIRAHVSPPFDPMCRLTPTPI